MKNSPWLLVVVGLAACTARAPQPGAAPAPVASLGEFSGEMDALRGTFTIRSGGPGRASGPGRLIADVNDVTVANDGTPSAGFHCTAPSDPSWGVPVRIAPASYDAARQYYDVFAEITAVAPTTGYSGCNSATPPTAPPVVSDTYGLWYYPSLDGNAGVSVEWAFGNPSAGRTVFTGKVLGRQAQLEALTLDLLGVPVLPSSNLVQVGTSMAYATMASGFAFLDADGTVTSTAPGPTTFPATKLASDASATRIWFLEGYFGMSRIGFAAPDGTGLEETAVAGPGYGLDTGAEFLAVSASGATKAWFTTYLPDGINSATWTADGVAATLGTPILFPTVGQPRGLAVDPAGNVYVSRFNTAPPGTDLDEIRVYDATGVLVADSPVTLTGTSCAMPQELVYNPGDGKIWFAGATLDADRVPVSRRLCTLDPSDLAAGGTPVLTLPERADSLAIGPDGNVWAFILSSSPSYFGPVILRGGGATFSPLRMLPDTFPMGLSAGAGRVWVYDNGGMPGGVTMVSP